MRRPQAFALLATVAAVALALAVMFGDEAAQATESTAKAQLGKTILLAENLTIPVATEVVTPWVKTDNCTRMLLVVRDYTAPPASLEFYTSMDGVTADTWWTDDTEDNFTFVEPGLDAVSFTYAFSAHGQQPAAGPWARVTFAHGSSSPETVGKAWIYCVT